MAKANPIPTAEKTQQKIDRLEAKKIILQSKVDVLLKGILDTEEQITTLRAQLSQ